MYSLVSSILNKQVPLPVPVPVVQVPVQVQCINYWHSVTLQLHKVKWYLSYLKNKQLEPMNFKHKLSVVKSVTSQPILCG